MMKIPYQVVIVGGGISGLATAYALTEEGAKI
ncbi:MAG: FAD-binding oxidoreductase, partial [Nitrospira sp.]|nr:FAD-binding oxidoreductase [Nitrospira sp.]